MSEADSSAATAKKSTARDTGEAGEKRRRFDSDLRGAAPITRRQPPPSVSQWRSSLAGRSTVHLPNRLQGTNLEKG